MGPHAFEFPPQTDTAAWARMLAAARGADKVKVRHSREIYEDPFTKARVRTLLPIARALYDKKGSSEAMDEWKRMERLRGQCQEFLPKVESPEDLSEYFKRGAKEPMDLTKCDKAARKLFIPLSLKTLYPISADAIGTLMIPHYAAWRLLRLEMSQGLEDTEKELAKTYLRHIYDGVRRRSENWNVVQPLRKERFVSAVLERAPPLVGALPPQWTSPDKPDELLEALQALLGLGNTRRLAKLVRRLSQLDYEWLVQEHSCLSPVLQKKPWARDCANERSLGDYTKFVRILRLQSGFKGSLQVVPPKPETALASAHEAKDASTSRLAPPEDRSHLFRATRLTKRPEMEHSESDAWHGGAAKRTQPDDAHRDIQSLTTRRPAPAPCSLDVLCEAAAEVERTTGNGKSPAPVEWQSFSKSLGAHGNREPVATLRLGESTHRAAKSRRIRYLVHFQRPPVHEGLGGQSQSEELMPALAPEQPHRVVGGFAAPSGEQVLLSEQAVPRSPGLLTRSDSATAVSSVSVSLIAVAGAVAALGLVILVAAFAFRLRARRVARGRSQSQAQ